MIRDAVELGTEALTCDVCVVGSGAAGAAAAWTFARAGLDVICLEAGGNITEAQFSNDSGRAYRLLYDEDGQRVMSGRLFVPLTGGRCLGGSTVINSAICFRPPKARIEAWQRQAPLDFGWDELSVYVERTWSKVGVAPTHAGVLGGNNTFCERGRERLGWSGGPMLRNTPGCIGCGVCNTGCPVGGKRSVAKAFIPEAEQAGARFLTRCRVETLRRRDGRIRGVEAAVLDPETRAPRGRLSIDADRVVVAAGAIQSPILLQRNGLGNEHVGEHLCVHPCVGATGIAQERIEGWRGATQGWYSDEFLADDMVLESFWANPEVFMLGKPFGGAALEALAALPNTVALGGIIGDRTQGSVRPGQRPGLSRISYDLCDEDVDRLVRLEHRVVTVLLAGGASGVQTGFHGLPAINSQAEADALIQPGRVHAKQMGNVYASHPQATARMGLDPRRAAVDCSGALYGAEGLHVVDASVFPSVLGVNPQITVMSVAQMLSDRIVESAHR